MLRWVIVYLKACLSSGAANTSTQYQHLLHKTTKCFGLVGLLNCKLSTHEHWAAVTVSNSCSLVSPVAEVIFFFWWGACCVWKCGFIICVSGMKIIPFSVSTGPATIEIESLSASERPISDHGLYDSDREHKCSFFSVSHLNSLLMSWCDIGANQFSARLLRHSL